jgi:transglutaminase/protease-like cytokinesis protein 3
MEDHEKELAIHDWIAEWTAYDEGLLSNAPDAEPHPENDNPYGLLIGQQAACEGYALTFQLFMDMLGIECITVYGTVLWGEEEHVWNMVRLDDGEWYCVDVTWDDTADVLGREGAPTGRKYFNVTSDYMLYNDHQWDPEGIPEATSERFR